MSHQASQAGTGNLGEKCNISSRAADDNAKAGEHMVLYTMPCLSAGTWTGLKWRRGKTRPLQRQGFTSKAHSAASLHVNAGMGMAVHTHTLRFLSESAQHVQHSQAHGFHRAPGTPLPSIPISVLLTGALLASTV